MAPGMSRRSGRWQGPDETLHCGQPTVCLKAPFTALSNRAVTHVDNWHRNTGNLASGTPRSRQCLSPPGQAGTKDSAHMHMLGLALSPSALTPRRADSATRRDSPSTHLYSGLLLYSSLLLWVPGIPPLHAHFSTHTA